MLKMYASQKANNNMNNRVKDDYNNNYLSPLSSSSSSSASSQVATELDSSRFPTSMLKNLLQNSDLLEILLKPISNFDFESKQQHHLIFTRFLKNRIEWNYKQLNWSQNLQYYSRSFWLKSSNKSSVYSIYRRLRLQFKLIENK